MYNSRHAKKDHKLGTATVKRFFLNFGVGLIWCNSKLFEPEAKLFEAIRANERHGRMALNVHVKLQYNLVPTKGAGGDALRLRR